jgi:nitric oxide reductase NorQ protein
MSKGIHRAVACNVAIVLPITDDPDLREALNEAIAACV